MKVKLLTGLLMLMGVSSTVLAAPAPATVSAPTVASAATATSNLKIGVLDVAFLLANSPEAKTIGDSLRKEFQTRENALMATDKSLKEKEAKMERNNSVMGDAERAKLEKEIYNLKRDLHRMQAEFREDTSIRQREEMEKFLTKVRGVVKDIAKAGNYNLILHSEAVPYADDKINITKEVMNKLGQAKGSS